ncbi:MAG: autotransporter outer membrane beta-barrel domain-containing protein [Planctomycetota bacterium]|jgi:outer membrane autotransporter protein|nr:autotransporter outer membrane beta-barrel domain-containing protein [Planctomycetota bacterium]
MKKMLVFLMALVLAASWLGSVSRASEIYSDSPYAAQIGMQSFNMSIAKRLESVRLGFLDLNAASAPLFGSGDALAAPSSRAAGVKSSASRRYLDCVYNNGFTVWGDFYQTWAKQSSRDGNAGYEYRASAPAFGLDWSGGNFSIGLATTYNWGRLKSREGSERLKARSWDTTLYGQYNVEKFYVSGELSYGYNRYKGTGAGAWANIGSASYHSNSFNLDVEFGMKFNFRDLLVTPHAGMRLFTDRRDEIGNAGRQSYYSWETPLGVNLAYAVRAGGALIVPRIQAAWIPELARRRARWGTNWQAPRHARNGFLLGAGIEAKITKQLSGHIDYTANFRKHANEHHWNFGVGFTF